MKALRMFSGALPLSAVLLCFGSLGEAEAGSMFRSSSYDAGILPRSLVKGDFDGNGLEDLAVLAQGSSAYGKPSSVTVLLGNGDGTFLPAPSIIIGPEATSLFGGDLDLDGRTDLVIDLFFAAGFLVRMSNGDGTFHSAPDIPSTASSSRGLLADFTGDAKMDLLIITGQATATFEVLRGAGDGTFASLPAGQTSVASIGLNAAAGDVNLDGKADVVTGTGSTGARVFLSNGDGTFNASLAVSQGGFTQAHLADMNRDGRPDLLIGFESNGDVVVSMYRANGDGTFQQPAAWSLIVPADGFGALHHLSTGSINGDLWPDLVVTTPILTQVLVGSGDGLVAPWTELNLGLFMLQSIPGDFDRQGGGDLSIVALHSHSAYVLLGNTDSTFDNIPVINPILIPFASYPRATLTADLNQDGIADLAGRRIGPSGSQIGVARGLSGGGWGTPTYSFVSPEPRAMIAKDVSGGGVLDLVTANAEWIPGSCPPPPGSVSVLIGVGNGSFLAATRYQVGEVPQAVKAGDLDGDGDLDLVVANGGAADCGVQGSISILPGNGNGTFAPEIRLSAAQDPRDLEIADLNGDGRADLAVAHAGTCSPIPAEVSVRHGNGDLTFNAPVVVAQGFSFVSLAADDLDRDIDVDLVATDDGEPLCTGTEFGASTVLLNDGTGGFLASPPMQAGVWPLEMTLRELNGDGIPDLMVAHNDSFDVAILPGRGDGTFGRAERYATFEYVALLPGLLNGDSRPDLVVATSAGIGAFLNVGSSTPQVRMGPDPGLVTWTGVPLSAGYDLVKGNLSGLRAGGFTIAISDCLKDDGMAQALSDPAAPTAGDGFIYLVRPIQPSGVPGTYDGGGTGQAAPRDAAIAASGHACP